MGSLDEEADIYSIDMEKEYIDTNNTNAVSIFFRYPIDEDIVLTKVEANTGAIRDTCKIRRIRDLPSIYFG